MDDRRQPGGATIVATAGGGRRAAAPARGGADRGAHGLAVRHLDAPHEHRQRGRARAHFKFRLLVVDANSFVAPAQRFAEVQTTRSFPCKF